jgi:hypothetical protein
MKDKKWDGENLGRVVGVVGGGDVEEKRCRRF